MTSREIWQKVLLLNKFTKNLDTNDQYINQFAYVESIINSAREMLPVLKQKELVSDKATDTIYLILDFTIKQLKILPELLIVGKNQEKPKEKLIQSLKKVSDIWLDAERTPVQLEYAWNDFVAYWKRYNDLYNDMLENGSTIVMSLN